LKKNGAKHVEIAVIARHGRPKLWVMIMTAAMDFLGAIQLFS
jgi:hypothetical protein